MTENLLSRGAPACAWFFLIGIIIVVAVLGISCEVGIGYEVGIICEQGATASTILPAIAFMISLSTAWAALTNKNKKTNRVMTVTALLSTSAALLVREAETIRHIVTGGLDTETVIPIMVLPFVLILIFVILRCNREDDQPCKPPSNTSGTT